MFPLENGNEVYNYYTSTAKEKVLVCMLCRICDASHSRTARLRRNKRLLSFISWLCRLLRQPIRRVCEGSEEPMSEEYEMQRPCQLLRGEACWN